MPLEWCCYYVACSTLKNTVSCKHLQADCSLSFHSIRLLYSISGFICSLMVCLFPDNYSYPAIHSFNYFISTSVNHSTVGMSPTLPCSRVENVCLFPYYKAIYNLMFQYLSFTFTYTFIISTWRHVQMSNHSPSYLICH